MLFDMTLSRLMLFVFVAVQAAAPAATLPAHVRAAADRITAEHLARDVAFLASDDLRGRNTPSPGFDAAAAFIVKRLEQAGVKPFGDAGAFFQRYAMRESRVDAAATYVEIGGRRFRLDEDVVLRSFAGPLSGTWPVVYVGHGWTVPDRRIDPYEGLDVRGRIVLAHGPRAMPKGVTIPQLGRVSVGASSPLVEAARRGAAGVLFIPQSGALAGWDALRGQNLVRRELDPPVPSAYAAPAATSLLLARPAAEALMQGERLTADALIALGDAEDYPASFTLTKRVSFHIPASSTVHRPYNVVGLIEGRDPALRREYVTVEAHLDGAVGSRTVDGDGIYNAADDNATGSAGILAIAERMMTIERPKRSVIFIWDSGEEQGLWGTRHFVAHPPVPLEAIVAHVNVDMIGATRAPGTADADSMDTTGPNATLLIGPGVLSERTNALIEQVNRAYLNMDLDRRHDRSDSEFFYPRTDAGPFLERGILTVGWFTGLHRRYHQPSDEARFLDPGKMQAVARTVFATLWVMADANERPRIDKPIPTTVPRYR
jgi:hypothetical protein